MISLTHDIMCLFIHFLSLAPDFMEIFKFKILTKLANLMVWNGVIFIWKFKNRQLLRGAHPPSDTPLRRTSATIGASRPLALMKIKHTSRHWSSSSIGCGAGDHKVSPCATIISKCGNLLFLHCSFIIPKQSLYIIKVWSTWSTRSPFANGWNVQSISSSRLFLWHSEDVTKKFQLAVPNQMNQRHSVSHGIDGGVQNMVNALYSHRTTSKLYWWQASILSTELWSFHTRTRSVWVNRRYQSHAACELHTLPISRRWGKRSGFYTFCWSRRQLWLKYLKSNYLSLNYNYMTLKC